MDQDSCFHLGFILKPHGTKGEVQLFLDVDDPKNYGGLDSLFLEINSKLIPFFIKKITIADTYAIVKFEDVSSIEEAERLKSVQAYLPLEKLPKLQNGQFYYHEIIGYEVVDAVEGNLGPVEDIISLPQHDVLIFKCKGKEVLAPLHDEVIREIDHENKAIYVTLPEGLLDVYLNP